MILRPEPVLAKNNFYHSTSSKPSENRKLFTILFFLIRAGSQLVGVIARIQGADMPARRAVSYTSDSTPDFFRYWTLCRMGCGAYSNVT